MKKLVSMLLIAVFLTSLIATIPTASSTTPIQTLQEPEPMDGSPQLENVIVPWAQPDAGNTWTVLVSDDYYGGFYYQDFECVLQGVTCNIWIGLSPDVWSKKKLDTKTPMIRKDQDLTTTLGISRTHGPP